jgi:hypothetical protein
MDKDGNFVTLKEFSLASFSEAVISEEDRDLEESVSAQQSILEWDVRSEI